MVNSSSDEPEILSIDLGEGEREFELVDRVNHMGDEYILLQPLDTEGMNLLMLQVAHETLWPVVERETFDAVFSTWFIKSQLIDKDSQSVTMGQEEENQ